MNEARRGVLLPRPLIEGVQAGNVTTFFSTGGLDSVNGYCPPDRFRIVRRVRKRPRTAYSLTGPVEVLVRTVYGGPGTFLWLQEPVQIMGGRPFTVRYPIDGGVVELPTPRAYPLRHMVGRTRQASFMPKELARYHLQVRNVSLVRKIQIPARHLEQAAHFNPLKGIPPDAFVWAIDFKAFRIT